MKRADLPVVGFRNLKPLPVVPADRAIITSDGATITARLLNMKRTTTTATATCSPKDTFRFGPGALLAMYRALDNDEDRMLAMDLIGNEALRELEAELPNARDLVFGGAPHRAFPRQLGEVLAEAAEAMSNAFEALASNLGGAVTVIAGTPHRGESWLARIAGDALGRSPRAKG